MAMADADHAAGAVVAALDFGATPETRQAAMAFLDSIKSGDVRALGRIGIELCKQNRQLEVRHHGLKLLQHLVRARWDELNPDEKQSIAGLVANMITEIGQSEQWAVKSQTAMLVAEIARRESFSLFQNSLATISDMGPVQAEIVAMVLRWLPEEVFIYNDDLEGVRRKQLLTDLSSNVLEINRLMFRMLEKHFASGQQNPAEAKQHGAVVAAVLNSVLVYAQWAPADNIFDSGLVQACGYLLNVPDFRFSACAVFKQLTSRRDNVPVGRILDILSPVCDVYFQNLQSGGDDDLDFAECLCGAMMYIGVLHITSLEQRVMTFYKQMLCFLQHPDFSVHMLSLQSWVNMAAHMSVLGDCKAIAEQLLDIAFIYLSRDSQEELPTAVDYGLYRHRLTDLVRLSTYQEPALGVAKVMHRLSTVLSIPPGHSASPQDLSNFQSSTVMLEGVLSGMRSSKANIDELHTVVEGFVQRVLSVQWSDEKLVELHAQLFDSLCPFLHHVPRLGPSVIEKLFQILLSVPIVPKEKNSNGARARMQVCTSILRVGTATKSVLSAHLQSIADTITKLVQNQLLVRGEQVTLCEFLIVASGDGKRDEVLDWVFAPFQEEWSKAEFQQRISSPAGLVQLLLERNDDPVFRLCSEKGMWYIYHTIVLFDKGFRRSLSEKCSMARHLSWLLPPLLQILRCLHALWVPSVRSTLPAELQQAMQLSVKEQAVLLGEANASVEVSEDELRNWLKGVRENGYSVLNFAGFTMRRSYPEAMVAGMAGNFAAALVENISSMEFRHMRQLLHLVIQPLTKRCPPPLHEEWLGRLLPPILVCAHGKLTAAWDGFITDGVPRTDTSFAPSSELKKELVEERILRDLTREFCSLLSLFGSDSMDMLMFLMRYNDAAFAALHVAIQSLKWPDAEVVQKNTNFCRGVITLAVNLNDSQLTEIVAKDMFSAIIHSLTLESNVTQQTSLLSLLRQILVGLSSRSSSPREVLMSLPSITQQELTTFEESFKATVREREHHTLIRNLLLAAGGDHLKALKIIKPTTILSAPSSSALRDRMRRRTFKEIDEAGHIGLAAIHTVVGFENTRL